VGALPVKGDEELKQTNEIKTAIPLLDAIDIRGKDITVDALLTQRAIDAYLVGRKAHYHFTVKGNQSGLLKDLALYFQDRKEADFVEHAPPDHGRIKVRSIWITTELNEYLDFPHVGQAFVIERRSTKKKGGKTTCDIAYGITSRRHIEAKRVLKVNRDHWTIENSCHYILDWNYDEDGVRYPQAMARKTSRDCAGSPSA
jgi:predicted transposase YbfD/YdcC